MTKRTQPDPPNVWIIILSSPYFLHDAYRKLESVLKEGQQDKVLLIDFSKAYNSVKYRKLVEIIDNRYTGWMNDILKQIILKQSICIFDQYYKPANGIPQGSSVSPFLFNLYIDTVTVTMKEECPDMQFISYADDLVLWGEFYIKKI